MVDAFREKDYQLLYHYSRYVIFGPSSILVKHQEYLSKGLVILVLRGSLKVFSQDFRGHQIVSAGQVIGTE